MNALDVQVSTLKQRLTDATRTRIRAEHQRDTAAAQAREARQQLADEFGVTTVADAQTRLAQLEADLTEAIASLTADLDTLGA